ncbi:MAG: hypothetical protein HC898_09705 [Phycisphaerales bacterium]|nr:hypothetical protein [Phycisphaerales bacterium]
MSDALKKVRTGDPLRIPAAAYNSFIDSAIDLQTRQMNQARMPRSTHSDSDIVLVKNATGADQDRFAVLGIDRPIYRPMDNLESFKNTLALQGIIPTTDNATHTGRFVVLAEPLKADAIGRAYIGGVIPVRIFNSLAAGAAFDFADIDNNNTARLTTVPDSSAQILWRENTSAEQEMWAVVRLGVPANQVITNRRFDAGTTNMQFKVPASVLKITAVGGGGGGGSGGTASYGTQNMSSTGGGGAAGQEIIAVYQCVIGDTLLVTVGNGGSGGSPGDGADGGDTSVIHATDPAKLRVIAYGGRGGRQGTGTSGGNGGGYAAYGISTGQTLLKSKFGYCFRQRGNPGHHGHVAPGIAYNGCALGGMTEWGSPVAGNIHYGMVGPGVGGNGYLSNGSGGRPGLVLIEW